MSEYRPQLRPRFHLGRVVATPGALRALEAAKQNASELLQMHQTGDFGTVGPSDREANEQAIARSERILSSYILSSGEKVWIITEADRSSTCLLTPDEY